MDEVKERIAKIVGGVNLEKKARATKKEKETFASLKDEMGAIKKDIDKLSLRLWHACYKNDYHSLSAGEARELLGQVRDKIDVILNKDHYN